MATHIMDKLICNNSACDTEHWASKMVPIEIRGFAGNGYSAVVYNKRCKNCHCLGNLCWIEVRTSNELHIGSRSGQVLKWRRCITNQKKAFLMNPTFAKGEKVVNVERKTYLYCIDVDSEIHGVTPLVVVI
ncbi:hypothetical protein PSPO01_10382 [Paraphaeosphaeria sporulosa]